MWQKVVHDGPQTRYLSAEKHSPGQQGSKGTIEEHVVKE